MSPHTDTYNERVCVYMSVLLLLLCALAIQTESPK